MSQDKSYLLKKLHSLTGIIPLGIFIIWHFIMNSFLLQGAEKFDGAVELLHSVPYLWLLELVIAIGFLFHAAYGLYMVFTARYNLRRYSYKRNWAFVMQRVTAVLILIFLLIHVYLLKFSGLEITFASLTQVFDIGSLTILAIGTLAAMFHFANGISTFLISWGWTVGGKSQKYFGYVSLVIFFVLVLVGVNILRMFG